MAHGELLLDTAGCSCQLLLGLCNTRECLRRKSVFQTAQAAGMKMDDLFVSMKLTWATALIDSYRSLKESIDLPFDMIKLYLKILLGHAAKESIAQPWGRTKVLSCQNSCTVLSKVLYMPFCHKHFQRSHP